MPESVATASLPAKARMGFGARLVALAAILLIEALLIFVHVRDPLLSSIARWEIAFLAFFAAFGYLRAGAAIRASRNPPDLPFSRSFFGLHLCSALAVFFAPAIFAPAILADTAGPLAILSICAWVAVGLAAVAFAGLAFLPLRAWMVIFSATGYIWIAAALLASVVSALVPMTWLIWDRWLLKPAADLTFQLVRFVLGIFLSPVVQDRATMTIGTVKFAVIVGGQCSGWEGVGLVLAFTAVWLYLFRRECRFPHALLLIPAGMFIIFALNVLRITALILIGHAGAARVAMGGFHSQAGWIAFNLVALCISWGAPRVAWIRLDAPAPSRPLESVQNSTIPFLLPFAAILAAGMLSRAVADRFEWLYPLRFLAASLALWICRRKYAELKWRVSWFAPLAGAAVFAVWLALDRGPHAETATAAGLASLPRPLSILWIVFRALAAVTTVPLAEELAFRGFAFRRLISRDFDSVGFRQFTILSVLGSSLAFGLLHGDRWLAGTLAGLLYAAAMVRRGSIGDAVAAHAVTNLLLAAWVLYTRSWYLW